MKNLVLILNCCNPDNSRPLCYCPIRSIFSPETRLEQLEETIKSIQDKLQADIILLENSTLTEEQKKVLSSYPVKILDYSTDQEIFSQSISPFKGPTELLMLKKFFREEKTGDYDRFFKVSGRYTLTADFSVEKFSEEKITLRKFPNKSVSTVMFSVPKNKIAEFLSDVEISLEKSKNSPISIEAIVGKSLANSDVEYTDYLGITGLVSVDGTVALH